MDQVYAAATKPKNKQKMKGEKHISFNVATKITERINYILCPVSESKTTTQKHTFRKKEWSPSSYCWIYDNVLHTQTHKADSFSNC